VGFAEAFGGAFAEVAPVLNERARRLLLGAGARQMGRGGIKAIAAVTGVSQDTVGRGAAELEAGVVDDGRVRASGAGRKPAEQSDPQLWPALDRLVDPETRGDPMSALRWTTKSTAKLAEALTAQGHRVSPDTVAKLLKEHRYSLQGNAKTIEGKQHPDRAVESIRRWWDTVGRSTYPTATKLLITADGGGSNGSRLRLWKTQLAEPATQTGLQITVCHLPPGTSTWNKIEHRMFSAITMNWRGRLLQTHEVVVETIAATTTTTGLTIQAALDTSTYQRGIKITDKEMKVFAERHLHRHEFHGDWNYTVTGAPNDSTTRPNKPE
jgi:transposase